MLSLLGLILVPGRTRTAMPPEVLTRWLPDGLRMFGSRFHWHGTPLCGNTARLVVGLLSSGSSPGHMLHCRGVLYGPVSVLRFVALLRSERTIKDAWGEGGWVEGEVKHFANEI